MNNNNSSNSSSNDTHVKIAITPCHRTYIAVITK